MAMVFSRTRGKTSFQGHNVVEPFSSNCIQEGQPSLFAADLLEAEQAVS
jgi:hypothetical protein